MASLKAEAVIDGPLAFTEVHLTWIVREDLGLVATVWAKADPARRAEIEGRVRAAGGTIEASRRSASSSTGRPIAGPPRGAVRLEAHNYSRGPMGYGMGKLEILEHDGEGNLTFEERPFVVMVDQAFVELGTAGDDPGARSVRRAGGSP